VLDPEGTERRHLVVGQGIGGARVAPAHVPRVFEIDDAHVVLSYLMLEHGAIEVAERRFREDRDIEVGGDLHGAVVGGLDTPLLGQH
jgi:hypothetical protein